MLSKLIHLALVAALVGCPLCCLGTSQSHRTTATATEVAPRCSCCHHHGQPRPAAKSDREQPPPSPEDSPCQCICGGAVNDGSRDAASFSADSCSAFYVIVPIGNEAVELQLATAGVSAEYNDLAAHPRRMSCLYSVWRC